MNSLEIAVRNLLASQGFDEATIDMLAQDQNYVAQASEFLAAFIFGPYGNLVPAEQFLTAVPESTSDDADLVENYIEGYQQALCDTVQHIDNSVIAVPCECAAVAVHNVLQALKADIEVEIDRLEAGEDDIEDTAPVTISDLFSLIFGTNVGVIELESSKG